MLPRTVTAREHEPAESILFRLALANGFRDIETLLVGTPNFPREMRRVRYSRNKYIALVARLSGVAEDLVEAATPNRNSGGMTIYGNHFRKIRAVGKARVCTVCLMEDASNLLGREALRPYRRNWWEIQNIGTCPVHATPLIDCCPKCSKQLQLIDSPAVCACDRSMDLRCIPAQIVPEQDLLHDRWLLGRLGIYGRQENDLLEGLPIDVGSRLCMILGTFVENNYDLTVGRLTHPRRSFAARSAGWRILQDWPHIFDDFLDRLVETNSSAKKVKSTRTARYSGLARLLGAEESPELEVVFEAIRDHVRRNLLVSPTTRILGQNLALGKRIALSAAARTAGCGEKAFLKIAKTLGMHDAIEPEMSTQTVPTDQIDAVKAFVQSSIDTTEVSRLLNCGPKVVHKLIDAGVLRLKLSGNLPKPDLVNRSDVERLVAAVSVPLEEMHELGESQLTVRQAHRDTLFGEAGFLMALAAGGLRAVGRLPGLTGFKSMIFDRTEVVEAIQIVTGKTLSARVLNEKGWKVGTLLQLRRMGYLDADLRADYVDLGQLKEFLAHHVGMGEMLEWEGTPSTWGAIRRILRANDVFPLIPNSSKVSAFWRRSCARQALQSQLI
ncbi:TniQ family protein [Pacificimonas sp. ICDLI1SI03]